MNLRLYDAHEIIKPLYNKFISDLKASFSLHLDYTSMRYLFDLSRLILFKHQDVSIKYFQKSNLISERQVILSNPSANINNEIYPGPQIGTTLAYLIALENCNSQTISNNLRLVVDEKYYKLCKCLANKTKVVKHETNKTYMFAPWFDLPGIGIVQANIIEHFFQSSLSVSKLIVSSGSKLMSNLDANAAVKSLISSLPTEYICLNIGLMNLLLPNQIPLNSYTSQPESFYDYIRRSSVQTFIKVLDMLNLFYPIVITSKIPDQLFTFLKGKNFIYLYPMIKECSLKEPYLEPVLSYVIAKASKGFFANATGGVNIGRCAKNSVFYFDILDTSGIYLRTKDFVSYRFEKEHISSIELCISNLSRISVFSSISSNVPQILNLRCKDFLQKQEPFKFDDVKNFLGNQDA